MLYLTRIEAQICLFILLLFLLVVTGCTGSSTGDADLALAGSQPAAPAAPSLLKALGVSLDQIDLAWQDNSEEEDLFVIERSLGGSTFFPIAAVPENTTFFSDPELPEDTTFYYRVIASNGEGDSGYSNKAEGATLYTHWARSFGDMGAESPGAVIHTSDQGFLAAGSTTSFGAGEEDFWLMKTDSLGQLEWEKSYGGALEDLPSSVIQTQDEGYLVAGSTRSFGGGERDIWILKLDALGVPEWQKSCGGPLNEEAVQIFQTMDGGYFVAGSIRDASMNPGHCWALKLDPMGGIEWQKQYDSGKGVTVQAACLSQAQGYLITGGWGDLEPGSIGPNVFVHKLDASGNTKWMNIYPTAWVTSLAPTQDKSYVLAGYTATEEPDHHLWIWKMNEVGEVSWRNIYWDLNHPQPEVHGSARSIAATNDWGIIVAGTTDKSDTLPLNFISLMKVDGQGVIEWARHFDGGHSQAPCTVFQMANKGFMLGGTLETLSDAGEYWLLKTGKEGDVTFSPASGATVETGYWKAQKWDDNSPQDTVVVLAVETAVVPQDTQCLVTETQCTQNQQAP